MNKDNSNIDLGKSFKTLKNTTMKVTIKRVLELNSDPYFQVSKDEFSQGVFTYRPNEPEDSIYNEALNLARAKEMATKLERGATRVEEIIYETPEDQNDIQITQVDDIPSAHHCKPGLNNE